MAPARVVESVLAERWWAVAVRGALAVLFGGIALLWPGITFAALVLVFGAYAFADGVVALVSAFTEARPERRRWPLVLEGLLGIGAGLVTVFYPRITAVVLLAVIAGWAIVGGIFEIVEAVRLRRQIQGEWLLGLAGALSVAFGVLLALFPEAGAVSIVWLLGAYALAFGALFMVLAARLRRAARARRPRPTSP